VQTNPFSHECKSRIGESNTNLSSVLKTGKTRIDLGFVSPAKLDHFIGMTCILALTLVDTA
jgi:hypothetical protein